MVKQHYQKRINGYLTLNNPIKAPTTDSTVQINNNTEIMGNLSVCDTVFITDDLKVTDEITARNITAENKLTTTI